MTQPPAAMCIDCRVLLRTDEPCDVNPRHRVVPLDTAPGRQDLADEVWSVPRLRLFASPESRLLLTVFLVATFVITTLAASPTVGVILFALPIFLGLPTIYAAQRLMARARGKKLPRGVPSRVLLPPATQREEPLQGRIRATSTFPSPLSGRECLGYSMLLRCDDYIGGDVLLGHGEIASCEVELDDGRVVTVPPGRVRLELEDLTEIADRAAVDHYLASIESELIGQYPGLPYDHAWEGLLQPGDRVAVFGTVTNLPMSYRESASRLLLSNVPRIRVLTE